MSPASHGTAESYLGGCRCAGCLQADLIVPEVAARLRCGEWAARRLINAPDGIRGMKTTRWLVRAEDIEAYLDKKANRRRRRRRAS